LISNVLSRSIVLGGVGHVRCSIPASGAEDLCGR
jgi:hypothetical protein